MNDVISLIPAWNPPKVSPLPVVGQTFLHPDVDSSFDTIIACVRHCGCPFAAQEIMQLAELSNAKANKDLRVVVVCMSPEDVGKAWFEAQGGQKFKDQSRVKLLCSPRRDFYAGMGLGSLPFFSLFGSVMWQALFKLKAEGIVNTTTGDRSYRWQNSGGVAIKRGGEVAWVHEAAHAGDTCNYTEAVASLI